MYIYIYIYIYALFLGALISTLTKCIYIHLILIFKNKENTDYNSC